MGPEDAEEVISRMKASGQSVFRPEIDNLSPRGYSYPEGDKFFQTKGAETLAKLEELADRGILARSLAERVRICASCGSRKLELIDGCSRCGSSNIVLEKGSYLCLNCGERYFSSPLLAACRNCGRSFPPEQSKTMPIYIYRLPEAQPSPAEREREIETVRRAQFMAPAMDELRLAIDRLTDKVERLERILETSLHIRGEAETPQAAVMAVPASAVALRLGDHLQKTYEALQKRGSSTSEEISSETGRSRALENMYLNQLVTLGLARKERIGKKIYFTQRSAEIPTE